MIFVRESLSCLMARPTEAFFLGGINDLNQKVVYILGGFLVTNQIVSEVCQTVHQKPVFKV